MARMANGTNEENDTPTYDELITQLDLAYRDGDIEEINRLELALEIELDSIDQTLRGKQSVHENWLYLE